MSEKKLRRLPLAAAAMAACVSAHADYQSPDGNFRLSGFGTIGAARSSTDDAVFAYPGQGGGATKHASLDPDSKIAVQGTYKFAPTVSATTQVMTKYDADSQYVPNIEWAFAKWQATPGLSLRAGRMGAPYFMVSDFRDVGYANTTVRPNYDVYGQVPVSSFDGLDGSYQLNIGDSTITSTLWTGQSRASYASASPNYTSPTDVLIKRQLGLNIVAELADGLTLRVGRSHGKLSITSNSNQFLGTSASQLSLAAGGYAQNASAIAGALAGSQPATAAQIAAAAPVAAQDYAVLNQINDLVNPTGVDASFTGIGLAYDKDNWVANLEYTERKTKSFISNTTGWYGMLGYRISKFTPYFGLSRVSTKNLYQNPLAASGGTTFTGSGGLSPQFDAAAAALTTNLPQISGGVASVLSTQMHDQHTSTIGVRWDAVTNMAFKFQWDHIIKPAASSSGPGSTGMFLIPDPTASSAQSFTYSRRTVNVLSMSVDFVF